MTRTPVLLDWLNLDKESDVALFRQLYLALRLAITENKLVADSTLPSSRVLSKELGVSRNTVVNAYEMLTSEGFLLSRSGSATQISGVFKQEVGTKKIEKNSDDCCRNPFSLSKTGNLFLEEDLDLEGLPTVEAFLPGNPDHNEFPLKIWKSKITKQYKTLELAMSVQELSSMDSEIHSKGYGPLRESISTYLRTSRMLSCEEDQIFVFTSCRAALDFTCRMLCDSGDKILVEEPGYDTAKVIARMNGLKVVPANVEQDGLCIDTTLHNDSAIKLAYVTPSHQWPTGVSLSLERRHALLQWAVENNTWIVEDDYDSEFRYTQKPLSALQSLDKHQKVIYVGSFSKVLIPSIQAAYLVVPKDLVVYFERAFWYTVQRPPIHTQKALAEFMNEGYFTSHIRKMRGIYNRKQILFIDALNKYLPEEMQIDRPPGGMQVVLQLPREISAEEVSARAATLGLHVRPMSIYSEHRCNAINGLHLGFAMVSEKNMEARTKELCEVIMQCK